MERERRDLQNVTVAVPASAQPAQPAPAAPAAAKLDWRQSLPLIAGARVSIRALRESDAPALFAMVSGDDVTRFISPPPVSVHGFERFIECANLERESGAGFCFAVVPEGMDVPVGLFQVRRLEPSFETAEWGFALGSAFWGTGIFNAAARMVLQFSFEVVGVHRMEARATIRNGRGNSALRKLGAVQEGVLRRAFQRGGQYYDQVLWAILSDEWPACSLDDGPSVH